MKSAFIIPLALAARLWADFSPLDVNANGIGTLSAPLGARERAMGNSGLASTPATGVSQANPSRLAFQDKHSFTGTLETTLEYLHDDDFGNRRSDAFLPGLTLAFPTQKFGALGLWYWQTAHRNFTLEPAARNGVRQSFFAEGGLFELGAAYSYAFNPYLAVGVDIRKLLGRERFIKTADFNRDPSDPAYYNSRSLAGDTLQRDLDGLRQGVSLTFRQKFWNAAIAVQTGSYLDLDESRHITGITTGITGSQEIYLPWQGTVALALKPKNNHTVTLDLNYAGWDEAQGEGLNPGMGIGIGYEKQGSKSPYDAFLKRCAWRAGGGYESLYLESSWQGYATVGLGLPLGVRGHSLDIALLGGHRELGGNSFVAEEYLKLSLTVQGVGVWGQPARRRK